MEHAERYKDTILEFDAIVLKPDKFEKGYFVPGRMAMTCCAEDMQFLGYACKYDGVDKLNERDWVRVKAKLVKEYFSDYKGVGPVLHAISVEKSTKPVNDVIGFG